MCEVYVTKKNPYPLCLAFCLFFDCGASSGTTTLLSFARVWQTNEHEQGGSSLPSTPDGQLLRLPLHVSQSQGCRDDSGGSSIATVALREKYPFRPDLGKDLQPHGVASVALS